MLTRHDMGYPETLQFLSPDTYPLGVAFSLSYNPSYIASVPACDSQQHPENALTESESELNYLPFTIGRVQIFSRAGIPG